MKSPDFEYVKPSSMAQALSLLDEHRDDAQILAGGQSLLAMMNLRMSWPKLLIDITGLAALRSIEEDSSCVRIGALITHHQVRTHRLVALSVPLLSQAAAHVAHLAIRHVGTIGGSMALADPAAEYPAVSLALGATVVLASTRGERRVRATDFFLGMYKTALMPGEIITAIEFPKATAQERFFFAELSRRRGDYAMVGLAMSAKVNQGFIEKGQLAYFAVQDQAVLAVKTMESLLGPISSTVSPETFQTLRVELSAKGDLQANAQTKNHLAGILLSRALKSLGSSS